MATSKKTLYQKLRSVKKKNCEGKATAADLTAAGKDYVADAVAKGNKTNAEAKQVVADVKAAGCPIAGTKRKPKPKPKPKANRRRA